MDERAEDGLVPIRQEVAPLRTRIIESMRRAIERGALKPGERLVEKDLCEKLGVSRTSLREALRELEAEGVIAQATARGLIVAKISRKDAENIYRIRADVEALIVEQFVVQATDEELSMAQAKGEELVAAYERGDFGEIIEAKRGFYAFACSVTGNTIALDLLSRLTLRTAQLRSRSVVRPERQIQSIREVRELMAAIQKRDVKAARKAAKAHVNNAAQSALSFATP